jgi:hypothetical protein
MTREEIYEFMKMFRVRYEREVQIPTMPKPSTYDFSDSDISSITSTLTTERGYQFVISERQMERLIAMLKQKGYYHDDDYTKRLREEELILAHPELKRMHDEYKMLLYILCGDEWRGS